MFLHVDMYHYINFYDLSAKMRILLHVYSTLHVQILFVYTYSTTVLYITVPRCDGKSRLITSLHT